MSVRYAVTRVTPGKTGRALLTVTVLKDSLTVSLGGFLVVIVTVAGGLKMFKANESLARSGLTPYCRGYKVLYRRVLVFLRLKKKPIVHYGGIVDCSNYPTFKRSRK